MRWQWIRELQDIHTHPSRGLTAQDRVCSSRLAITTCVCVCVGKENVLVYGYFWVSVGLDICGCKCKCVCVCMSVCMVIWCICVREISVSVSMSKNVLVLSLCWLCVFDYKHKEIIKRQEVMRQTEHSVMDCRTHFKLAGPFSMTCGYQ